MHVYFYPLLVNHLLELLLSQVLYSLYSPLLYFSNHVQHWISHDYQMRLTRKTVRPDVYIACSISGALQHIIGVKNAKTIIVINKDDPSANPQAL